MADIETVEEQPFVYAEPEPRPDPVIIPPTLPLDPADHYWQAEDGRIFSRKAGAVVGRDDPAFVAWRESGRVPTPWPKDEGGAEIVSLLVPQSVSRAQAKIALQRSGHLDMVKTAVGADPEAEIWFEDATIWERQNPYVIDLGEKLLGGADEIDAMFIAAAKIAA